MANIIGVQDFVGELNIPNISQPEVANPLNVFTQKYEPRFLIQLFGMDFYDVFLAGGTQERFVSLVGLLEFKRAIAGYVYYWFTRNKVTLLTDIGEAKTEAANAVRSQAGYKQEKSFNDMVLDVYLISKYIYDRPSVYPEYVAPQWLVWRFNQPQWWLDTVFYYSNRWRNVPEIFTSINSLNL